jgi:hypothetical protein
MIGLVGCKPTVVTQVSCSTDQDCIKSAEDLFGFDMNGWSDTKSQDMAGVLNTPHCCASICMVKSVGCASFYRFMNTPPAIGSCVPVGLQCVFPDMSVAPPVTDMNMSD